VREFKELKNCRMGEREWRKGERPEKQKQKPGHFNVRSKLYPCRSGNHPGNIFSKI
jgi:hypothetical protein